MPATLKEFVLPGIYDYPPLLHCLWALFPLKRHLAVERWSSAAIDAMHAIVVYGFATYFYRSMAVAQDTSSLAFSSALIFIMSPALLTIGTGPRAYQGTPRTLGELLFTLTACFAMVGYLKGGMIAYLLAALCGSLLLLTSKFAVQVVAFFYAVFTLGTLSTYWLILLILNIFLALIISRGHYAKVAVGHIEHSRYYLHAISKRFHLVAQRNNWQAFKQALGILFKKPFEAAKRLFLHHSYTHLLINHPLLYAILIVLFSKGHTHAHEMGSLLLLWIGAGVAAFLLTSLKPFLFLGEAERYLEYALLPQILYLGTAIDLISSMHLFLSYFGGLYLFFVTGFIYAYRKKAKSNPRFRELVNFLRHNDQIGNLLPIYLNDAVRLAFETEKGVAHFPANFRKKLMPFENFFEFYPKVYPFPNNNLRPLMKEYRIDTLYYSTDDLEKATSFGLVYNFDAFKTIFSNSQYTVLQPIPEPEMDR